MSLARTLMNGGFIGSLNCDINPARYGHAQGATVIAMESVEELHEIFLESYNYEQAELAAATEGVALEGSQYEAVAEAAIGGMFAKIKDFFIKLWNKVKAFFHEVRKYLDSIFMSGKDFCKKYEKEIKKLDNLKDFSYKMFKYNNDAIDSVEKIADIDSAVNSVQSFGELFKNMDFVMGLGNGDFGKDDNLDEATDDKDLKALDDVIKEMRKDDVDDIIVGHVSKSAKGSSKPCTKADDFDEWLFGLYRNGATSADDKEEIDLTNSDISGFCDILRNSKASDNVSKVQSTTDKVYKKAIDGVNKAEKQISNAKGKYASKCAEALRAYSSLISKAQGYSNRIINEWKTVIKERDNAYKSCIMAAFSNNRKNSK